MDYDYAHYMFMKGPKCRENLTRSSPSSEAYQRILAEAFNVNKTRILAFKNKTPTPVDAIPNFSAFQQAKPVKPRRHISKVIKTSSIRNYMGDDWQVTSNKQPHQPPMSSGLARYQSAPSSYFASLLNNSVGGLDQICNEIVSRSTLKIDHVFSTYAPDGGSEASLQSQFTATPREEPNMDAPIKSEYVTNVHDQQQSQQQGSGYSSASQSIHQNQSQISLPNWSLPMSKPAMDNSYSPRMNIGGSRNTNLIRQSSSPANFFSNFDIDGYDVSKIMGNFGGDTGTNLEPSIRSPNKLKHQLDFPSVLPSSSGVMTPISEIENKNMEISGASFPFSSWDDSDSFPDGFLKGLDDNEGKSFPSMNASENQNDEIGKHRPPTMLSHHLSLPKTSAELSSMEKFLQLQDSVPCRTRAKRGCATHPRSIAERVRRTRISERMRKLQELVPNMDKQTNTSDMLDLAVDYIKDLQGQVQNLSDNRANCTCSNQQTQ